MVGNTHEMKLSHLWSAPLRNKIYQDIFEEFFSAFYSRVESANSYIFYILLVPLSNIFVIIKLWL